MSGLKLWIATEGYTVPENADRYSWNGECLEIRMPDWIADTTPARRVEVRESVNGTPFISASMHMERYEMTWKLKVAEKEKLAIEQFILAVKDNRKDGHPFPHILYAGELPGFDAEDWYITIMPQEIGFVEYYTQQCEQELTQRKYTADIAVRLSRRVALTSLDNQYIVQMDWEDGTTIKLGLEHIPKFGVYGWLAQIPDISSASQVDGFGSVANITLNLAAFQQYNTLPAGHPLENLDKHITGISEASITVIYNNMILFKGSAYTPFRWAENDYILSFDVVMNVKSDELGFQPEFPNFDSKENWPHVFGSGMFPFRPLLGRPQGKLAENIYVTWDFSDPENFVYPSGAAFNIPVESTQYLPTGVFQWHIPVESGNVRVQGNVVGAMLYVQQFNLPVAADIPLVEIAQYGQYKKDRKDYQPNTLVLNADPPYLVEKHIKAHAWKKVWAVNQLGQFVETTVNLVFWASIIGQDGRVLYIENVRDAVTGQEMTLSGWTPDNILYVLENRLFEPNSTQMLPIEEVKDQRDSGKRKKYLETGQLAIHLRKGSSITCLDWIMDKIYAISLDVYTTVNRVYEEIDHVLYGVPVVGVYRFTEGELVSLDFTTTVGIGQPPNPIVPWQLDEIKPYMPDDCTLMLLGEHLEEVQADVVNDLNTEDVAFDFVLQKYTDLTARPYRYTPLETNFITRDKQDVRVWLAGFCKERGKRIVVHRDQTVEMVPIFDSQWNVRVVPPVKRYNDSNIEANSFGYDSLGIENLVNKMRLTSTMGAGFRIVKGDQRYPENEGSALIKSYWDERIWQYWVNWTSKVWRKVTFNTFLNHLPPSPLETVSIDTFIYTGRGIVESTRINGDHVTITVITEEEVI